MLNRIILIGRLTRDVELNFTQESGKAVANFTLAVDRPFKNANGEKEADFIRIVVWGKLAELCSQYIGKGRLVAVDGRLQIRSYDGNDGQRKYITEVVAKEAVFLDKPKEEAEPSEPTFDGDEFENTDGVSF
jgi:single-strand DNA-binding protein